MKEIRVGTLSRFTARELADRATEHVMGRRSALALCLDPDGLVTLEAFDEAVFEDVVGVYSRDPGLIAVYRNIRDDLTHAVEVRGVTGRRGRRYVQGVV